jgi:hypothetical protein
MHQLPLQIKTSGEMLKPFELHAQLATAQTYSIVWLQATGIAKKCVLAQYIAARSKR